MRTKQSLVLLVLWAWAGTLSASPAIQHWLTPNGARVYFTPAAELPMVDVRVVFAAGSARDGDAPGLAVLSNGLLAEGAATLDAGQIAERFEQVGANFSNGALRDMAWLSLRSLTDPALLTPALQNFHTVLVAPSFPGDALERERQRLLVMLTEQAQEPSTQAELAFYRAIYREHPYASPTSGTADSVTRLTRKQVQGFYQRFYVAKNAVIAIVGAVDRAQAEAIAAQVVDGLLAGEAAPALPELVPPPATALRVPFPASQTHVWLGQLLALRTDPDYPALYLGNHLLGGSGLTSRLSQAVREQRGLAYSASTHLLPMEQPGPWLLSLQTQTARADEALQVARATVQRLLTEGPGEAELQQAKQNLVGGFPLLFDSNQEIVQYLALIGFYHLPLDYLARFPERIQALSLAQVKDALTRRLRPETWVEVQVGKPIAAVQP